MDLNRKNMHRLMLLIVFAAAVLCCVLHLDAVLQYGGMLAGVLSPFVFGGALAFILNVPMSFIQKKLFGGRRGKQNSGGARAASLLLAILFVAAVVCLVAFVVIPELARSIRQLIPNAQYQMKQFALWADEYVRNNPELQSWLVQMGEDSTDLLNSIVEFLQGSAHNMITSTVNAASSIVGAVMNFVLALIFACYILAQKETLGRQFRRVLHAFLPQKAEEYVLRVIHLSARTFASFITGQCLEACILGTLFFFVLTILRFPYALLIGILIAFTALIPIFGAFIGCAISAVLILTVNPLKALIFIGIFLLLQQFEGNLIYPRVVGGSVGLAPIWVFAAVIIGGDLFGVIGMLVFIPLTSVLYALFREWVGRRCERKDARRQ
ncbi:MAG: AI-2E family transporter [Butyricicoccaceae bacterium]